MKSKGFPVIAGSGTKWKKKFSPPNKNKKASAAAGKCFNSFICIRFLVNEKG